MNLYRIFVKNGVVAKWHENGLNVSRFVTKLCPTTTQNPIGI